MIHWYILCAGKYERLTFHCECCHLQTIFADEEKQPRVEHCGRVDAFTGNRAELERRDFRRPNKPDRKTETELVMYEPAIF